MRLSTVFVLLPSIFGAPALAQSSVTVSFPAMAVYGTRDAPRVSGTLRPGVKVKIRYDRGRLMNSCYATQGDRVRFRFNGQSGFGSVDLWSGYGNNPQAEPVLQIPADATRFEVYFERFGQNKSMSGAAPCTITADASVKVFPTSAAPPRITALPNWTHPSTRPVLRGQQVTFDYKRTMMSQCRQGMRIPRTSVTLGYKSDAGTDVYVSLARGQYTIKAPTRAHELVFWFRGLEGTCPSWESDYSRNWHHPLYWPL